MRAALAALICCLVAASGARVHARDLDGRYANNPLKPWFDKLSSRKGLCCSFADGISIRDVDWDTQGDSYRVRICVTLDSGETWATCAHKEFVIVPDAALVTEPNRFGPAVVWPYLDTDHKTQIRCFIPGAES